MTASLALLADAAHNLTDVAGLLIAWDAAVLAQRVGSAAHYFGYGRAAILTAKLNTIAIMIGVVVVIWEAAHRFQGPVDDPALTIMLVALVGIGVNTGFLLHGRQPKTFLRCNLEQAPDERRDKNYQTCH